MRGFIIVFLLLCSAAKIEKEVPYKSVVQMLQLPTVSLSPDHSLKGLFTAGFERYRIMCKSAFAPYIQMAPIVAPLRSIIIEFLLPNILEFANAAFVPALVGDDDGCLDNVNWYIHYMGPYLIVCDSNHSSHGQVIDDDDPNFVFSPWETIIDETELDDLPALAANIHDLAEHQITTLLLASLFADIIKSRFRALMAKQFAIAK